jgi:hypothetical protein
MTRTSAALVFFTVAAALLLVLVEVGMLTRVARRVRYLEDFARAIALQHAADNPPTWGPEIDRYLPDYEIAADGTVVLHPRPGEPVASKVDRARHGRH